MKEKLDVLYQYQQQEYHLCLKLDSQSNYKLSGSSANINGFSSLKYLQVEFPIQIPSTYSWRRQLNQHRQVVIILYRENKDGDKALCKLREEYSDESNDIGKSSGIDNNYQQSTSRWNKKIFYWVIEKSQKEQCWPSCLA